MCLCDLIIKTTLKRLVYLLSGFLWFSCTCAQAAIVDPKLQVALEGATAEERFPVIIILSDRADLSRFADRDISLRRRHIVAALKQKAKLTQQVLENFIKSRGVSEIKSLWLINGLAASLPVSVIERLTTFPIVESIRLDEPIPLPESGAALPELSITDASVDEGAGSAVFTVSLSEPSLDTVTVDYHTTGDTATAGADYIELVWHLTFFPGETTQTIPVPILEDTLIENDETFVVTLTNAVAATLADPDGIGTITDNDTPVLSIDDITVDEGAGSAVFSVTRTANDNPTITVNYATSDGTAIDGNDYTSVFGELTFASGETLRTITVDILEDTLLETDETFGVTLSNVNNAILADASGTGTITDNDTPSISIDDVTVDEGAGSAVFTVSRAGPSGLTASVDFATSDASASAGADYSPQAGPLTFAPGVTSRTIPVPVLEDAVPEGDETFTVNLSNPVNATLADAIGLGNILENDPPVGTPTWNITATGAPDLWAMGYLGQGIVVAGIDTGVDVDHPDLASRWRGGNNSWFDVHGQHTVPFDAHGHGTRTMGLMVGGDANQSGNALGMAPGSKWIAVKVWDDTGNALNSDFTLALQWILDPDGDPSTDDAPAVVNNSWGFEEQPGICDDLFRADIQILKSAGIAVVFAAGNRGALGPDSSISPGNNPEAFAVGAVDESLSISGFSSRGPSACDGSIFPELVAPGAGLMTTDLSGGGQPTTYFPASGTSFSAPHVTGAMALLLTAFPNATVPHLESTLIKTARDLGPVGADNDFGYGMIDVVAAFNRLQACHPGGPDSDGDGIPDACDNCTAIANADQRDTNGDGFGNICDADFDGNGVVDSGDVSLLKSALRSPAPDQDLNGNGVVDSGDYSIAKGYLRQPPGPSCVNLPGGCL